MSLVRGSGAFDVRWDGERMYRPLNYDTADTCDQLGDDVLTDDREDNRYEGRWPFYEEARLRRWGEAPVQLRSLEGDVRPRDRLERQDALAKVAESLVVHGGGLWQWCGEPCYRYRSGGFHGSPWLDVVFVKPQSVASLDCEDHYRATKVHQVQNRTGRPDDSDDDSPFIEVVIPEAFRLDLEGPALFAVVRNTLESAKRYLEDGTKEGFSVYADLRDAVKSQDEHSVTLELEDAIQRFAADPQWHDLSKYRLVPCLERWLTRDDAPPEPEDEVSLVRIPR